MRRHYPSLSRCGLIDIQFANGQGTGGHSRQNSTTAPSKLHLTPPQPQDSTRVQLQKQRLSEQQQQQQHHHAIVVSQKIPGVKTSAAFFASLRTNLNLNASSFTPPPSPGLTPPSLATSTHSLPPPSPLSAPVMDQASQDSTPIDPLAGVPELRTYVTTDEDERVDALKLVADGVAQMRQQANTALISHPLNLAVFVAILALLARYMLTLGYDNIAIATTCTGIIFASLAAIRLPTQGYIHHAESINRDWLGDNSDILVTKFGDDVIGAAVVDWVSVDSKTRRKKAWRGEIKAWTVKMRYRGKGVGASLLEEVVKEGRKRGAEGMEFAEDHACRFFCDAPRTVRSFADFRRADFHRILPNLYNKSFDKREQRAQDLLLELQQSSSPSKHRRRRGGSSGGSR